MGVHGPSNGALLEWVWQLSDPLVTTSARVAADSGVAKMAGSSPLTVAVTLGGLISDVVLSLPDFEQVRNMGALFGPLSLPSCPDGETPVDEGAVSGSWGTPVGFEQEMSHDGQRAMRTFPQGVPLFSQTLLAFAGGSALGRSDGQERDIVVDSSGFSGQWQGVADGVGVSAAGGGVPPWSAVAASLLMIFRIGGDRAPDGAPDEAASEMGGVSMASAAMMAVRWGVWRRRLYLGSGWTSDDWPEKSVKRWYSIAVTELPTNTSLEHWNVEALSSSVVGDMWGWSV